MHEELPDRHRNIGFLSGSFGCPREATFGGEGEVFLLDTTDVRIFVDLI
jgi:hypothetical protein